MPVGTVDSEQYERFDLKTAPPDGYVMLRPLPYGMKVTRRSKATRMMMRQQARPQQTSNQQEQTFEIESMDEWAVRHDFGYCIGEHNLTDKSGRNLDFTKELDIKMLDPRIGSEIEKYIDKMNNDEDEETLEDFLKRSSSSLTDESDSSPKDGGASQIQRVNPSISPVG